MTDVCVGGYIMALAVSLSASKIYRYMFVILIPIIIYIIYTLYPQDLSSKITSANAFNKSHMKILCFGDSLTVGHTGRYINGKVFYNPYSQSLKILLNEKGLSKNFAGKFVVHNKGVNGEQVQLSMENRLSKILKDFDYDWVIILGGTNDLRVRLENPSAIQENDDILYQKNLFDALRNLHRIVHQNGGQTVAVTIPGRLCERNSRCLKIKNIRLRINELIRELASKSKGSIVLADLDRYMPMMNNSHKYWGDEVHFNPKGYDKMGALIYNSLLIAYKNR